MYLVVCKKLAEKELGTKEQYETNYSDTPFGLHIKIAKMDRDSAYVDFSTVIAKKRSNAEQLHFY